MAQIVLAQTDSPTAPGAGQTALSAPATSTNQLKWVDGDGGTNILSLSGKTLTASNSLTLAGTDGKSLTLTGSLTVPADMTAAGVGYTNANHLIVANGYAFQGIDANAGTRTLIQEAGLGYSEATYPGVRVGETGNHIALFVNPSANSGNQFSGNINELLLPNDTRVLVENSGSTAWQSAGRILDTHWMIGTITDAGQVTVNGELAIVDGMTAPSATSGWAKIYVDSADGDLKVKFGDGTVKTLATDT